MAFKLLQLVKLSVGYWDNSLIENFQIKSRAVTLDVDRLDGTFTHESIISAMGVAHTMSMLFSALPNLLEFFKADAHSFLPFFPSA